MIELIIQHVMQSMVPSSGDDLTGFLTDADHFFGSVDAFAHATVERTTNASCMVEMRAEITKQISSLQQINSLLVEVWNNLAYRHFQATSCVWFKNATVFRFVTVISANAFHVTGRMVIRGGHYNELVEAFERDYHPLIMGDVKYK